MHRLRSLRSHRKAIAFAAVAAISTVASASVASAYGTTVACSARSESPVFSRWSDSYNYFLMPNGGFESGSTDWKLGGGSSVASGNNSLYVHSKSDTKSLTIPFGGTAESRTICVSRGEDTIRLVAKNNAVPGSILHVEAIVRNPSTGQIAQTAFDVNGDAAAKGWSPTMRLGIPNLLGGDGTQELTLQFSTRGSAATWSIDDVYVDPFRSY